MSASRPPSSGTVRRPRWLGNVLAAVVWLYLTAGVVSLAVFLFLEFVPLPFAALLTAALGVPLAIPFFGRRYYAGAVITLVTMLVVLRAIVDMWTP